MIDDHFTVASARLAQLQRQAHAAAAETAQIAARLQQESHTAWSRSREVCVTVGPDALIQNVEFTPGALSRSPEALAYATLDAHHRALALLRTSVEDVVSTMPASIEPLAAEILGGARQMLPEAGSQRDDRHRNQRYDRH